MSYVYVYIYTLYTGTSMPVCVCIYLVFEGSARTSNSGIYVEFCHTLSCNTR